MSRKKEQLNRHTYVRMTDSQMAGGDSVSTAVENIGKTVTMLLSERAGV